jgi:hypothetical protein
MVATKGLLEGPAKSDSEQVCPPSSWLTTRAEGSGSGGTDRGRIGSRDNGLRGMGGIGIEGEEGGQE